MPTKRRKNRKQTQKTSESEGFYLDPISRQYLFRTGYYLDEIAESQRSKSEDEKNHLTDRDLLAITQCKSALDIMAAGFFTDPSEAEDSIPADIIETRKRTRREIGSSLSPLSQALESVTVIHPSSGIPLPHDWALPQRVMVLGPDSAGCWDPLSLRKGMLVCACLGAQSLTSRALAYLQNEIQHAYRKAQAPPSAKAGKPSPAKKKQALVEYPPLVADFLDKLTSIQEAYHNPELEKTHCALCVVSRVWYEAPATPRDLLMLMEARARDVETDLPSMHFPATKHGMLARAVRERLLIGLRVEVKELDPKLAGTEGHSDLLMDPGEQPMQWDGEALRQTEGPVPASLRVAVTVSDTYRSALSSDSIPLYYWDLHPLLDPHEDQLVMRLPVGSGCLAMWPEGTTFYRARVLKEPLRENRYTYQVSFQGDQIAHSRSIFCKWVVPTFEHSRVSVGEVFYKWLHGMYVEHAPKVPMGRGRRKGRWQKDIAAMLKK
eukprot:gnl/Dysnectes_brevis/3300_a4142_586.p1 GENE.gnl/Dysnectes_brevis/3300_a4142_586~~gnl/Dysnectes_brevis/3300_a4142_586.p1  ORF type:complete len:492 (-),score=161.52 gnl/Dysnectes_brevis/3300_a4142_586:29-1504(-)